MGLVDQQRAAFDAWLRRRDPQHEPQIIETHISLIALQRDRAFKLKKAVRLPFIDLSTLERRRIDCEREVTLNRRLAPDVYLGVVPLLSDGGQVIDHLVEMVRLPAEASLESIVLADSNASTCFDRLAMVLAQFHVRARTGGEVNEAASRDSVRALWERNATELEDFVGDAIEADELARVNTWARAYLDGRAPLFRDRIRDGRARDGHGDLLAADVYCMPDGPRAIDCLEFDDTLRYGDVLADVAFLAMDLERLDRGSLGRRFLDAYARATSDGWPSTLEHFYIAYRALVRAKVAAIAATVDEVNRDRARAHVALGLRHLHDSRVHLLLIGGPPATGKTTLARAVAAASRWHVLHSDEIRKELAGLAHTEHTPAPLDSGMYTRERREQVYTTLLDQARQLLEHGESVILDASWSNESERQQAADLGSATATNLVAFRCDTSLSIAQDRATKRALSAQDASDAVGEIVTELSSRFASWPDATVIQTSRDVSDLARQVLALVQGDEF